jgi:hypothetical protein
MTTFLRSGVLRRPPLLSTSSRVFRSVVAWWVTVSEPEAVASERNALGVSTLTP